MYVALENDQFTMVSETSHIKKLIDKSFISVFMLEQMAWDQTEAVWIWDSLGKESLVPFLSGMDTLLGEATL